MKKSLGTYFARNFKMPHLYRDDLKAIEKLIHEELKPKRYQLACGGFECDGLEDVPDGIDQTSVLVIYTFNPWMRLKLARSWAELYTGDDGSGVDEAIKRIALIVAKGERRWLWVFCKYSAWLAPLIGFGSLAITLGLIALELLPLSSLYFVVWLLGMVSIWWAVGHYFSLYAFSCIDLQNARGRASFMVRHRQKIVIFLAGLALGSATVWLLAKFVHLL